MFTEGPVNFSHGFTVLSLAKPFRRSSIIDFDKAVIFSGNTLFWALCAKDNSAYAICDWGVGLSNALSKTFFN